MALNIVEFKKQDADSCFSWTELVDDTTCEAEMGTSLFLVFKNLLCTDFFFHVTPKNLVKFFYSIHISWKGGLFLPRPPVYTGAFIFHK